MVDFTTICSAEIETPSSDKKVLTNDDTVNPTFLMIGDSLVLLHTISNLSGDIYLLIQRFFNSQNDVEYLTSDVVVNAERLMQISENVEFDIISTLQALRIFDPIVNNINFSTFSILESGYFANTISNINFGVSNPILYLIRGITSDETINFNIVDPLILVIRKLSSTQNVIITLNDVQAYSQRNIRTLQNIIHNTSSSIQNQRLLSNILNVNFSTKDISALLLNSFTSNNDVVFSNSSQLSKIIKFWNNNPIIFNADSSGNLIRMMSNNSMVDFITSSRLNRISSLSNNNNIVILTNSDLKTIRNISTTNPIVIETVSGSNIIRRMLNLNNINFNASVNQVNYVRNFEFNNTIGIESGSQLLSDRQINSTVNIIIETKNIDIDNLSIEDLIDCDYENVSDKNNLMFIEEINQNKILDITDNLIFKNLTSINELEIV